MSIYTNIKEIAQQHGLSLKEVALKAGVGENSIYRWDKNTPSMKSLEKVANALHVDVKDLTVSEDETPQYRAIQRKAKKLNPQDQQKLINFMDDFFKDEFND